jgi:hypothetical protein
MEREEKGSDKALFTGINGAKVYRYSVKMGGFVKFCLPFSISNFWKQNLLRRGVTNLLALIAL